MDFVKYFYSRGIPEILEDNASEIYVLPIEDSGDPLVPLGLAPEKIALLPSYFYQGISGALPTCFVRREVLLRLLRAWENLPEGYRFVVFDAWRPQEVQQGLFDACFAWFRAKEPGASQEELLRKTRTFVASPRKDPSAPPPHLTGGAVDLSIADEGGVLLPMGSAFDEASPRSATRYFEERARAGVLEREEEVYLRHRRLLFHVLDAQGFVNCSDEWWHFAWGTQSWAWHRKEPKALYGAGALEQSFLS